MLLLVHFYGAAYTVRLLLLLQLLLLQLMHLLTVKEPWAMAARMMICWHPVVGALVARTY